MIFTHAKGEGQFNKAVDSINSDDRLIICGDIESIELLEENIEEAEESIDTILDNADNINPIDWFKSRKVEYVEDFDLVDKEILGMWPKHISSQKFVLDKDIATGIILNQLATVTLSVRASWEIPAHFNYGGWNDCPMPEVHCALWKYWRLKYDAHIIGLSSDTIEAKVFNPPTTKDQAIELAWEQYLYCSDVVDQGSESISNLAASIVNHDIWFFWWD